MCVCVCVVCVLCTMDVPARWSRASFIGFIKCLGKCARAPVSLCAVRTSVHAHISTTRYVRLCQRTYSRRCTRLRLLIRITFNDKHKLYHIGYNFHIVAKIALGHSFNVTDQVWLTTMHRIKYSPPPASYLSAI